MFSLLPYTASFAQTHPAASIGSYTHKTLRWDKPIWPGFVPPLSCSSHLCQVPFGAEEQLSPPETSLGAASALGKGSRGPGLLGSASMDVSHLL